MNDIKLYIPASNYYMVGNEGDGVRVSADKEAARLGGFQFIKEDKFAEHLASLK